MIRAYMLICYEGKALCSMLISIPRVRVRVGVLHTLTKEVLLGKVSLSAMSSESRSFQEYMTRCKRDLVQRYTIKG